MNDLAFIKELQNGKRAVVIRIIPDTKPAFIVNALRLPLPSNVLLLSGGASLMPQEQIDRLLSVFATIGETLAEENVVVIDGGTQAGVMAIMGEALAKAGHSAPYIGVVPAYAKIDGEGEEAENMLERNHSHFILIESDEWGSEIETMCNLTTYMSAQAASLLLLANGGRISLRDLECNIKQGRRVMVLVGSGRLADQLANAHRCPNCEKNERINRILRDGQLSFFDINSNSAELAKLLKYYLKGEN